MTRWTPTFRATRLHAADTRCVVCAQYALRLCCSVYGYFSPFLWRCCYTRLDDRSGQRAWWRIAACAGHPRAVVRPLGRVLTLLRCTDCVPSSSRLHATIQLALHTSLHARLLSARCALELARVQTAF